MDRQQFLDLEIRIHPSNDRVAAYPVEIALGSGQEFQGYLSADILPWTASADPVHNGQKLFDAIFHNRALRAAWDEARGQSLQRRIRLRIDPNAPELYALPWELLHESGTLLSASGDTPFSRYLAVSKPWGGAVEERPIRVLVAISNPEDLQDTYNLAPLNVDVEQAILRQAFSALDEIELNFVTPPVTLERIEEALRTGYHILHYVGHGLFNKRRQQAALYLQDEEGDAEVVRDSALVGMLARQPTLARPRLIFLAACQSAARSTANAFLGLGPSLVAAGVPAVVAMQDFVAIETARKLSLAFYKRLAEHRVVDYALNLARSTLLTAGRPDAAVPVLFMRYKSGQLWQDTATQAEEPPDRGLEPKYNIHVKDSQVGVIGDNVKIKGGIHFGRTTHVTQTAGDDAIHIGQARDVTINK